MIKTVSDLLQDIRNREVELLDGEDIKHAPTIGAMYEGLTRDILDRVIPSGLQLSVVSGFIRGVDDELSPQIDAMVVAGEGAEVPYTTDHIWPLQDVMCVIEVKKNLYGADLRDGFDKLRAVTHMNDRLLQKKEGRKEAIQPAFQAFARLTGRYPANWEKADELPNEMSFVFHSLVAEQLAPVRVLLGFHGYVDEFALRKAMITFLAENEKQMGFGVTSFPNLIVARNSSLVKLNGQPYIAPISDAGWWPFLASNNENPLRILIELIWTRLSNRFRAYFPMDDTLHQERLAPILSAKLGQLGDQFGWYYNIHDFSKKQLAKAKGEDWTPENADVHEMVVLNQVARKGRLNVHDVKFRQWATEEGFDADDLIKRLVTKRLLVWEDDLTVRPLCEGVLMMGFMPTGESIVTSETDLLGLWTGKKLDE
jgi:hypothetical protein